jgi:outer membrane immunogenic protein
MTLSGGVYAADMRVPAKAPLPASAAAPVYTWTGCYLGGTAGVSLGSSHFGDGEENITYPEPALKDFGGNVGVTGGCNWQVRSFVLGIEGDWSWTDISKQTTGYTGSTGSTIQSKFDWFATVRARAGWAYDNILLYATGGVAFLNAEHNAQYVYSPYMCGQSGGYYSCTKDTETGFVVGAGIEAMIWQNWSVKLEYLFLDMPTKVVSDPILTNTNYTWNDSMHVVRLGLNYHF